MLKLIRRILGCDHTGHFTFGANEAICERCGYRESLR